MIKGLMIPPQQLLVEENMSNLTSASGEASVSSNQQSSFASPNPNPNPPPAKKKRNLPGNPDPEAEVIALSPKTLMATNRFICEICNKGFQRDQNLQLHRRGHNLPWKLKQRSSKEVRKKVYICPEITCVHHDPSRALGDLTGIKKHFSRKHGEKKWKCDKCSKKYAVQSDWKAHSKICGTREYRCDCGTLFSRRDSFITHRAFCDALAEESARSITGTGNLLGNPHPLLFPQPPPQMDDGSHYPQLMRAAVDSSAGNGNIIANHALQELTLKREIQQAPFGARPDLPAWLATQGSTASLNHLDLPSSLYSSRIETEYSQESHPPPPGTIPSDLPEYLIQAPAGPTPPPAHMSATALLQKAAQMGATMSRPTSLHTQMVGHGSANGSGSSNSGAAVFGFGLSSSSHHQENVGHVHGSTGSSPLLQGLMMNGMDRGSLEMLGSKRQESSNSISEGYGRGHGRSEEAANAGGISDGLTRDFLGLRAFSHRDLFSMAGLETCMSTTSSSYNEQQNKKPWHGN